MAERGPIFVVGVGRSGTSLLQSMLAQHSELAFPPETGFFRRYVVSDKLTRIASRRGTEAVEKILQDDRRVARTGLSAKQIVTEAANYGQITDVNLYGSLLRLYAKSLGKCIVGDKDPRLIEFLDVLHRKFPQAHIVHIIRDPRDVLASKKKAQWSRNHHWSRHVIANRVQISVGRRNGIKLFSDRYHEVIYEALIGNPHGVLSMLCSGLGMEFESAMLQFSDAALQLVSPDELSWKRETLGPLITENEGKWRFELTNWETAITERVCSMAMTAGGYQQSDAASRIGLAAGLGLRCWKAAALASVPVYTASRWIQTKIKDPIA